MQIYQASSTPDKIEILKKQLGEAKDKYMDDSFESGKRTQEEEGKDAKDKSEKHERILKSMDGMDSIKSAFKGLNAKHVGLHGSYWGIRAKEMQLSWSWHFGKGTRTLLQRRRNAWLTRDELSRLICSVISKRQRTRSCKTARQASVVCWILCFKLYVLCEF